MAKYPKYVQLDFASFTEMLELMAMIDLSGYPEDFRRNYANVMHNLYYKMNNIEVRCAYAELIDANRSGDEKRIQFARNKYLKTKRELDEPEDTAYSD